MKEIFIQLDVDVTKTTDSEEALKILENKKFDFIVSDLLMPHCDGFELAKKVKKLDSSAKIFILSADIQKTTKDEAEKLKILGFINKPLNLEKAKDMIERASAK